MIWKYLGILLLVLVGGKKNVYGQQEIIDSFEKALELAQPGYDQIDYYASLARLYMTVGDRQKWRDIIDEGMAVSEELDMKDGIAIMLGWENMYSWRYDQNPKKALEITGRAVELARESGNKDALSFAMYLWAENFIREKGQFNRGIEILKEIVAFADSTVTQKNLGNTLKNIGMAYFEQAQYDSAFHYYDKALECFYTVKNNPDKHYLLDRVSGQYADQGVSNIVQTLSYIGDTHLAVGNVEEALKVKYEGWNLCIETNQVESEPWMRANVGKIYMQKGELDTALTLLLKAKEDFVNLKLLRDVNDCNITIGRLFNELQEYESSLLYLDEAYDELSRNNDTLEMLNVGVSISDNHIALENYEQALKYLRWNEIVAPNIDLTESVIYTYIKLGEVYNLLQDQIQADKYFRLAVEGSPQLKNGTLESDAYLALSDLNLNLGNLEEAAQNAEYALQVSKEYQLVNNQKLSHKKLADIYEVQNLPQDALQAMKNYNFLVENTLIESSQDILRREQVNQNIDIFQKEKEAAETEAESLKLQNRIYIAAIVIFLILLSIIAYFYRQIQKVKMKLEEQNQQLQDLNRTKDKFFGIIAHDIRSPIIALESGIEQMEYYMGKGKIEKVQSIASNFGPTTQRLNSLLDNLLNWAILQTGTIPYHPDDLVLDDLVKHTIELFESTASIKKLEIKKQVDRDIIVHADDISLRTIIRNLMSNALKYSHEGDRIHVSASENGENVMLEIKDEGIGMSEAKINELFQLNTKSRKGTSGERGSGLGLILVKEMVELNKGALTVESEEGRGTSFKIILNKTKN